MVLAECTVRTEEDQHLTTKQQSVGGWGRSSTTFDDCSIRA